MICLIYGSAQKFRSKFTTSQVHITSNHIEETDAGFRGLCAVSLYQRNITEMTMFLLLLLKSVEVDDDVRRCSLLLSSGPPGIPVMKTQNSPRQRKNSQKFPFGKMLDFARSNTISTQTSNIYLNQLQWSVCRSVHATWSLKSWNLPKCRVSPTAFHPSHVSRVLTGSDRLSLYQQTRPLHTDVPRTLPPLRTPSIPGRECKPGRHFSNPGLRVWRP